MGEDRTVLPLTLSGDEGSGREGRAETERSRHAIRDVNLNKYSTLRGI